MESYEEYIENKRNLVGEFGFHAKVVPDHLFDFQKAILEWAVKKGRAAIFADCGLGKSPIELAWAQNVVQHTGGKVLLLTPLAVGDQMEREAVKFGANAKRSRDGKVESDIVITNYEQLHKYNYSDFAGVVCDESSILKNFNGAYKKEITMFMRKLKYRLLATATAAPNDFIELGTSSEALGHLGYMDMLGKFFKNDNNTCDTKGGGGRSGIGPVKWRLKGHAHDAFWRWVCSWSRAIRKPSDIGFDDTKYNLPELKENHIELGIDGAVQDGMLFSLPAVGLKEQRDEVRATLEDRCNEAAKIANASKDFCVVWCNLNDEGDLLERLIPDAKQVSGKDTDESKEQKLVDFSQGKYRVLITKPKIGAWGLNWQHCNHMIIFPSHSYEQYYQAVRRFWRFGQKRPVQVDLIYSKGYKGVVENLSRKQSQADKMFTMLVQEMNNSLTISTQKNFNKTEDLPTWLF
jgi:superfamily II DNA or RNA helicase